MARRKNPENESPEETLARRRKDSVADMASRSDKVSWTRKMSNMASVIHELEPIEEQIRELMTLRQPLYDRIAVIRADMVEECVHPFDHLTFNPVDGVVECKFCGSRFAYPGMLRDE